MPRRKLKFFRSSLIFYCQIFYDYFQGLCTLIIQELKTKCKVRFLPRDAYVRMHSADYAVPRCLSVCLSVCHTPVLSLNGYTYPQSFFTIGQLHYSSFPVPNGIFHFSDGDPLTGASNARGIKKLRFSINIGFYLGADARQSHNYYGRRIGNRTQTFEWYQFQ